MGGSQPGLCRSRPGGIWTTSSRACFFALASIGCGPCQGILTAGPARPPQLQPSAFTEEDADESAFVNCRPLVPLSPAGGAPAQPPAAEQGDAKPPAPGSQHCPILYGNESLFVLLRLYQFVYERMHAARTCALQVGCRGGGRVAG